MSDLDEKLTEIRARHAIDQRWHGGPSMICPQSHEDRGWLLTEIERLRARVEMLERVRAATIERSVSGCRASIHELECALRDSEPSLSCVRPSVQGEEAKP